MVSWHRVAVASSAVAAMAVLSLAGTASAAPTKLSQGDAESQLGAVNITHTSSGNCTTRSNGTCTSYDQINQATVTAMVTLRNASGCALNITGGTEVGHQGGTYTHYNGYKVDVRRNSCIDSYVTRSFNHISNRPGDHAPRYRASSGNVYANEGSHWDVVICGGDTACMTSASAG